MNTLLPALNKLRSFCMAHLQAHGLAKAPRRRQREIQLEFHWR